MFTLRKCTDCYELQWLTQYNDWVGGFYSL